jgi:hypothetical protein
MRHLVGFVLALVMSAALFLGAGLGVWKFASLHLQPASTSAAIHTLASQSAYLPIAALIGTALLLGILLVAPRVSPLGTGLPGLVLLGWSALVLLHWSHALSYVPMAGSHYAAGFTAMLTSGVLALLGAVMILPLFVPSRWRSGQVELDEYVDADIDIPSAIRMAP